MVFSIPFVAHLALVGAMALAVPAISHLFGQRGRKQKFKDTPYECGIPSQGIDVAPVGVKFTLPAILFLIFDISLVVLLPWVVYFKTGASAENGPLYLCAGLLFVMLIGAGLFYAIKSGGLDWEK
jgi:NADH-quinone oxidoreductase subunit A